MTDIDTEKEKESLLFSCHHPSRCVPGYLGSTLHDECGELGHHKVHTFEAWLFEFENLLFDYRLKSQVRGEEPRSERSWGQIACCCGGREREKGIGRNKEKRRKEDSQGREEIKGEQVFVQLVISSC